MAVEKSIERRVVLIVEDDELARHALTHLVRQAGYLPIATDSGESAISILNDRTPSAALVDLNLPGMNGLQLIRRLKSSAVCTVPILMTAAEDDEVEAAIAEPPAVGVKSFGFLRKPLQVQKLLDALRTASSGKADFLPHSNLIALSNRVQAR